MSSRSISRRTLIQGTASATATALLMADRTAAQGSPVDAAEMQELRIAAEGGIVQLDPHLSYGVNQIGLFTYFLWAGLTKMDETLSVAPDIATDWDISEDGRIYTFHLDPDRAFSDGSPLTAHDVVWSWTRSLNPETESLIAGEYLRPVVGAMEYWQGERSEPPSGYRALDDHTLEVELSEPRNYFPALLVFPSNFVVRQSDVEAGSPDAPWYSTATAFSGPYAIESYEERQSLVLSANEHYPIPHTIQRLSYRLVDDPQTQFLLYQNDEVDVTPLGVADAANIKNEDPTYREELVEQPQWWEENLYLRTGLAPFDDEHVRRAFMLAIDEEAILQSVLNGLYPDIDGILYPGMDAYSEDIPQVTFDPESAQAELAQSTYGSADALPPISFWTTDPADAGTQGRLVAALQEMWRQHLGVEVETQVVPSYGEMLASNVQVVIGGEAMHYPDASNAVRYLTCDSGANISQFCDPDWDTMVEEAATTQDEARSTQLYQEAQLEVLERVVVYPLYQVTAFFLVKPRVTNLQVTSMYTFPQFHEVYLAQE